MQLVRPGVEMLDPIKQKPIREAEVPRSSACRPDKVVDVQALAGDPTDNVPGRARHRREDRRAAHHRIRRPGGAAGNAAKIKQPKRREALLAERASRRGSRSGWCTLDADAPLPGAGRDAATRGRRSARRWRTSCATQGFRSLLARLGLGEAARRRGHARAQQRRRGAPGRRVRPPRRPRAPGEAPFGPYETVTDDGGAAAAGSRRRSRRRRRLRHGDGQPGRAARHAGRRVARHRAGPRLLRAAAPRQGAATCWPSSRRSSIPAEALEALRPLLDRSAAR